MRIFFALIVLFFIFSISAPAQHQDDVLWFDALFHPDNQPTAQKQLQASKDKLRGALEMQDPRLQAKAYIAVGAVELMQLTNPEQAMESFIHSLALEDSFKLDHEKIFTLLAISRVFDQVGDYSKSADFLSQARELNEASEIDLNNQMLILSETGRINAATGNVEIAMDNYEQLILLARRLEMPAQESNAMFSLARLMVRLKKYDEALETHKNTLAIRRSLKDRLREARSLNAIGELYHFMKNDERARANHQAALEIRQSLHDKIGMAESYNNLGLLDLGKKDYKKALANLQLALQAGQEGHQRDQLRLSYDYLSQCYKEMKDFKKALEYKESLQAMDDFIHNENSALQLVEAQNRYMMTKKEVEINRLESGRKKSNEIIAAQNKQRNFLFALIVLGVIIGILVTFLYLLTRRSAKRLQESNTTKDKLFSIIGHDLKGPMNSLSAFSSLLINHAESLSKEEIKTLAQDLDKSLKNLVALLENLLQWGRSQTGNVDFKPESFDLAGVLKENEVLLKGQANSKDIAIVNESKSPLHVKAHLNSIQTVVRNLLSNAIKFTPSGGTITLNTELLKRQVKVTIADTGVGMSEETIQTLFKLGAKRTTLGTAKEKGTGLGLILCKEFVEKNGGILGVESAEGKGSTFYFTLPSNGVA